MYLNNFTNKLKQLRLSNNLTQQELANILETTKQAISMYESGKSLPSLTVLIKISEHFNISIDSLVFDKKLNQIDFTSDISTIDNLRLEIKLLQNSQKKLLSTFANIIKENSVINDTLTDINEKLNSIYYINNYITSQNSNSNEVTATLEADSNIESNSSSSDNVINLESYHDDKDFDLEYEQYLTREEDIDNNKYRSIPLSGPVAAGSPREPIECIEGYYNIPTNKLKSHCDYFLLRVDGDSMNKLYEKNDIILVRKQSFSDDGELVVAFLRDYGATFKRYYNNNGNVELHPESTNPIHKTQIYSPDEAFILGVVLGSLREYVD